MPIQEAQAKREDNSGLPRKRQEPGGESLWTQGRDGHRIAVSRGLSSPSKMRRPDVDGDAGFDIASTGRGPETGKL